MTRTLRHLLRFHHLPDWIEYDKWYVCAKCSRGQPLANVIYNGVAVYRPGVPA